MKTDRELLELAAKAAGIDARRLPDAWPERFDDDQWNPLIDDGDALRLAVKLHIGVRYDDNSPPELGLPRECAIAVACGQWFAEDTPSNPCAATRRAIVRAAAQIGEQS